MAYCIKCFKAFIDLVDEHPEGYNSSSGTYGAASSLRENGEVAFNFKTHDDEQIQFLTYKYRVRVDTVSASKHTSISDLSLHL